MVLARTSPYGVIKPRRRSRLVIDDRRLLVDRAAVPLHRARQTACQPRRMDAGASGGVERGDRVGHPDAIGDLRGVEKLVPIGESECLERLVGALDAGALVLTARQAQRAAAGPLRVDLFIGDHPLDLVDRVDHRAVDRARGLRAVSLAQQTDRDREAGIAPATVAPGCAEAGDVPLDDRDPQRWITAQEIVGRPETGVPSAHDRDVDVD